MTVKQAREAALRWMVQEGRNISGFCGAYTAGSTNWLADDAELAVSSDLDIMVVAADQQGAARRGKFLWDDTLLEVSYLRSDVFQSADRVLGDYHLAPSFRTAKTIFDPCGYLAPLRAVVARDYHKRRWVIRRCANARDKIVVHLRGMQADAPFHDQMMTCLFAAGITTHVLLVAGLRNPTVRTRYVAVRDLLADYGAVAFHNTLLELLGAARLSVERVSHHLATLTRIFDAAKTAMRTPFPFATDISDIARPLAIEAASELTARGYHREAMFWVAVTHCRCIKILSEDAPGSLTRSFENSYQELAGDLGLATLDAIRRRGAEIERMLPGVYEVAETIGAENCEIEDG